MITIRPAIERGATKLDWLDSRHTFSFGEYRDPRHVHFGPLRVINEDEIAPGGGFGAHSHRDMEIVTYMMEGVLAHEDSLGNRFTIAAGEVQVMSAGTGITHSEVNASDTEPARLLQIWILPDREGLEPSYGQRALVMSSMENGFVAIAAPEGRDGALAIHQDATVYAARLAQGGESVHELASGRRAWAQVAAGEIAVNGTSLGPGDGAGIEDEGRLGIVSREDAEFLLFDLP